MLSLSAARDSSICDKSTERLINYLTVFICYGRVLTPISFVTILFNNIGFCETISLKEMFFEYKLRKTNSLNIYKMELGVDCEWEFFYQ